MTKGVNNATGARRLIDGREKLFARVPSAEGETERHPGACATRADKGAPGRESPETRRGDPTGLPAVEWGGIVHRAGSIAPASGWRRRSSLRAAS